MKKIFRKIITPFLSTYEVTFTMYHVIPGMPVRKQDSIHNFEKGAGQQAVDFYAKVVNKTLENKLAPSEIKLKKGKRVIQSKQFGPINEIKQFKIVA